MMDRSDCVVAEVIGKRYLQDHMYGSNLIRQDPFVFSQALWPSQIHLVRDF